MEDMNKYIVKYLMLPLVAIIVGGIILSHFMEYTPPDNGRWETSKETESRQRAEQDAWYRARGVDPTIHVNLENKAPAVRDTYNNAEPTSDIFREFMEETDEKGIELGSPEAMEIWNTYYE
jgi:hypothetical protein